MKLYTPPEMSMKLVALGCTSQSGLFWRPRAGQTFPSVLVWVHPEASELYGKLDSDIPAFEFEDFAGELYFENLNKLPFIGKVCLNMRGPNDLITCGCVSCFRKIIVYSKNWVEEVGRGL